MRDRWIPGSPFPSPSPFREPGLEASMLRCYGAHAYVVVEELAMVPMRMLRWRSWLWYPCVCCGGGAGYGTHAYVEVEELAMVPIRMLRWRSCMLWWRTMVPMHNMLQLSGYCLAISEMKE